jgi:hypothetical protein
MASISFFNFSQLIQISSANHSTQQTINNLNQQNQTLQNQVDELNAIKISEGLGEAEAGLRGMTRTET